MTLQKIEQNQPLDDMDFLRAERLVDAVFERLPSSCSAIEFWSDEKLAIQKQQWVLGFIENGIYRLDQIQKGMKALRAKPDMRLVSVGWFIFHCKGSDYEHYGLPSPTEIRERLTQFLNRTSDKPMEYRSNAEYWLLSGIARQAKENRSWWTDKDLDKACQVALSDTLAKLKSGVVYGKPEQKTLPPEPSKPKKSQAEISAFWASLRKKAVPVPPNDIPQSVGVM